MLKWAKHRVNNKTYSNVVDAKIEFRCCMDRLTRDLKLYRIAPQDLIKVLKGCAIFRTISLDDFTIFLIFLFSNRPSFPAKPSKTKRSWRL